MVLNWTFHLLSLSLVFQFHQISLGNPTFIPLHLKTLAFSVEPSFISCSQLSAVQTQIRPCLEYCSHVCSGAPKSSLYLLDKVKPKTISLISMQTSLNLYRLSHRRLVADLSILYRCCHGHCSLEIKKIILDSRRRIPTTKSSAQSHSFQVMLPTLSHGIVRDPPLQIIENFTIHFHLWHAKPPYAKQF